MRVHMSLEEKRKLLDSAGSGFFSVEFEKKDHSIRSMNCKKWIERAFTYGSKNAKPSPFAGKPEYFLAVDMAKEEFRAINLNSLRKATINGKLYEFDN